MWGWMCAHGSIVLRLFNFDSRVTLKDVEEKNKRESQKKLETGREMVSRVESFILLLNIFYLVIIFDFFLMVRHISYEYIGTTGRLITHARFSSSRTSVWALCVRCPINFKWERSRPLTRRRKKIFFGDWLQSLWYQIVKRPTKSSESGGREKNIFFIHFWS